MKQNIINLIYFIALLFLTGISFVRIIPTVTIENDAYIGIIVTSLSIIVTIAIGYQIFQVVAQKERIDMIEKYSQQLDSEIKKFYTLKKMYINIVTASNILLRDEYADGNEEEAISTLNNIIPYIVETKDEHLLYELLVTIRFAFKEKKISNLRIEDISNFIYYKDDIITKYDKYAKDYRTLTSILEKLIKDPDADSVDAYFTDLPKPE